MVGSLVIMTTIAVGGTLWNQHALLRMHQPEQARYTRLLLDGPDVYAKHCDDWFKSATVNPCTYGSAGAAHTAVIIGDSVALQWLPALTTIFAPPDWRLVALTKSACPMVDAPIYYARINRIYTECSQWRESALQHVARLKPDIVLLGSTYTYDLTPTQWREGTTSVLKSISDPAAHIFLLRSTPRLPFDAAACLAPRSGVYKALASNRDCSATAKIGQSDVVYASLAAAARGFPNVSLIDMTDAVCPRSTCYAERDGIIVFRDSQHLTTAFVKSIAGVLAHALDRQQIHAQPGSASPVTTQRPSVPQSTP
jgi:hypothetical protein